ncbi:ficolin-2-like [Mercenaria mercenaria]|uniref:ficolin-2-like n=1 Tax=Mercenaria mercenaria TaxID=6596 RepID=UPI00234EE800|nr:ficolin-2-like [Mercenaria mercenaria]
MEQDNGNMQLVKKSSIVRTFWNKIPMPRVVFQRRFDGMLEFYRNFSEYENGFGAKDGEFWLGLKYIQELAAQGATEVRLDMSKAGDTEAYETFQDFSLTGTSYTLNIGSRTGSTGIADHGLQYHNGYLFTTFDRDRDSRIGGNCAVDRHGAWWYGECGYVNLNGYYCTPGTVCNVALAERGSSARLVKRKWWRNVIYPENM